MAKKLQIYEFAAPVYHAQILGGGAPQAISHIKGRKTTAQNNCTIHGPWKGE